MPPFSASPSAVPQAPNAAPQSAPGGPTSGSLPSSSPALADFCLASDAPVSFSLSQQTADALWAAVEAKAALDQIKESYQQALFALDELVEAGALPEKHLPSVNGFTIYRQEGRLCWTYPDSIKGLEDELKKRKQLAEQLGEASPKRGKSFWTIKPAEPLQL
jgi:hypothetical protein